MEQLMNNSVGTPTKKSNTTLWVMVVLFGLPYIAAMYFYMNRDAIELPTSNYGTIVTPTRQVPDVSMNTLENKEFTFSSLQGKWVLLTVGDSSCEQVCQENMYKMRQIRKAVGEERGRIERVFLLTDNDELNTFKQKLRNYYGMKVALAASAKHDRLLNNFIVSGVNNDVVNNGIYIIDPIGNFMMAYPSDADPEEILKDVRRLLKVSKIG